MVKEKLAACVNIIPNIKSIYKWKGKICEDSEYILFAKTVKEKVDQVVDKVEKMHNYEIPCIEVLDVSDGNKKYFDWVKREINNSI